MDMNETIARAADAARGAADAIAPTLTRAGSTAGQLFEKLRSVPVTEAIRSVPLPERIPVPHVANPVRATADLVERRRWRVRGVQRRQEELFFRRESGDRRGEAINLNALGREYRRRGRYAEAVVCYTQALAVFRELGNRRGEGLSLSNLGLAHADQGNRAKAIGCLEQALDIFRLLGDRHVEGQILANIGTVYRRLGQTERAEELWQEAFDLVSPGTPAHRVMAEHVGSARW
jgi:tetratricopeptide (TPR) repeat protein